MIETSPTYTPTKAPFRLTSVGIRRIEGVLGEAFLLDSLAVDEFVELARRVSQAILYPVVVEKVSVSRLSEFRLPDNLFHKQTERRLEIQDWALYVKEVAYDKRERDTGFERELVELDLVSDNSQLALASYN